MDKWWITCVNQVEIYINLFFCSFFTILISMTTKEIFSTHLEKIQHSIDEALPMNFDNSWQNHSFGQLPESVKQRHIQNLIEPNKNLVDLGGKRWRPLLLILCYERAANKFTNPLSLDIAYKLTPLVEFVHTASLIHDDIEDAADLRRGKPAAHITFGTDTAINSASWLYFEAPVCIDKLDLNEKTKLAFYQLYTNELRRLHLGQAMDIYWHREKDIFPTIEEYEAMVKSKTGTLAALAAQIGYMAGGANREQAFELGQICANIGIGFQIIDDVQNLTIGNPGKKRGDDIVEGKKSLPVLLHIQDKPEDKAQLSAYMAQAAKEGIDSPAVEKCIALLETSGCIQKACQQGKKLIEENCKLLEDSPLIFELFNSMIPEAFK